MDSVSTFVAVAVSEVGGVEQIVEGLLLPHLEVVRCSEGFGD